MPAASRTSHFALVMFAAAAFEGVVSDEGTPHVSIIHPMAATAGAKQSDKGPSADGYGRRTLRCSVKLNVPMGSSSSPSRPRLRHGSGHTCVAMLPRRTDQGLAWVFDQRVAPVTRV